MKNGCQNSERARVSLAGCGCCLQEQHTAELAAAQQAAAEAQEAVASENAAELTAKVAEVAALGMHAQKLQEKLDESPAAFKALAELKELRVKYKYAPMTYLPDPGEPIFGLQSADWRTVASRSHFMGRSWDLPRYRQFVFADWRPLDLWDESWISTA